MKDYPYKDEDKSKKKSISSMIQDTILWEKRFILNQVIASMLVFVIVFVFKFSGYDITKKTYKCIVDSTKSETHINYLKHIESKAN